MKPDPRKIKTSFTAKIKFAREEKWTEQMFGQVGVAPSTPLHHPQVCYHRIHLVFVG